MRDGQRGSGRTIHHKHKQDINTCMRVKQKDGAFYKGKKKNHLKKSRDLEALCVFDRAAPLH